MLHRCNWSKSSRYSTTLLPYGDFFHIIYTNVGFIQCHKPSKKNMRKWCLFMALGEPHIIHHSELRWSARSGLYCRCSFSGLQLNNWTMFCSNEMNGNKCWCSFVQKPGRHTKDHAQSWFGITSVTLLQSSKSPQTPCPKSPCFLASSPSFAEQATSDHLTIINP